jgi:putative FmdB family regulatory protein
MPRYEYICDSCMKEVELDTTMDSRNDPRDCPMCDDGILLKKLNTCGKVVRGVRKGSYNSKGDK